MAVQPAFSSNTNSKNEDIVMNSHGLKLAVILFLAGTGSAAASDLAGSWRYLPERPSRSIVGNLIVVEQEKDRITIRQGWSEQNFFMTLVCPAKAGAACELQEEVSNMSRVAGKECKLTEVTATRLARECLVTFKPDVRDPAYREGLILELAADKSLTVSPAKDGVSHRSYRYEKQQ